MLLLSQFKCLVGHYSTTGRRLSRGRSGKNAQIAALPGANRFTRPSKRILTFAQAGGGPEFRQIKPSARGRVRLFAHLRRSLVLSMLARPPETAVINTQVLSARERDSALAWIAVIAIPLLLIAPAIWNGYPLLQYDTGGYLARWYEGYLVPSRSTVFGLYLHFGQNSYFWINLGFQALATLWILQLNLRIFGLRTPICVPAVSLTLIALTALPWLPSMLPTDIFAAL